MAGRDGLRVPGGGRAGRRRTRSGEMRRWSALDWRWQRRRLPSPRRTRTSRPTATWRSRSMATGSTASGTSRCATSTSRWGSMRTRTATITWGEVKARHADIAAYALARLRLGRRQRAVPDAGRRAADRRPQRRRVRSAALHRDLRRGAEDARDRLSAVLRPRSAASRARSASSPRGQTRAGIFSADQPRAAIHARRAVEVGAVRRLRQRGRLAHLDGLRPRAVPAVAAAAGGACPVGPPRPALGAGSELPRRVHRRRKGRHRVHARAFDHAVAGGARRRQPAVALGRVGDRAVRACSPRSTTSDRWSTTDDG